MTSAIGDRGRFSAISLLVSLVLTIAWTGGFAPIDQALRAIRFQIADQAPSGETVLVEIDAASLEAFGVWPWPRSIHASLLDKLLELGAADIVFDIDFSTASFPEDDAALEAALERAGGYAFLAAFAQTATNGQVIVNRPLARFAAHADSVLVNVDGDGTHLLQSVPMKLPGENIPSVAARLVPTAEVGNQLFIDFGIDLDAIDRISVLELLEGSPDPGRFYNKQVIIGASAVELRDFFRVPRFGVVPGPLVQVAATETLKAGRGVQELGEFVALALSILLTPFLFVGRRLFSLAWLTFLGVVTAISVEVLACFALLLGPWAFDTVAVHVAVGLCLLLGLLEERSLRWREYLRQQARMTYLATHDPSSRAHSRQALVDQVNGEIASGKLCRISMLRLGRLDGAIVGLGHAVGEGVAREAARRIEQHIGRTPARVGRDLFAWLHGDDDTEGLSASSSLAMMAVGQSYLVDGHVVVLDPEVGLSGLARPQDGAEELLRQAEVALVAAHSLRSKTEIFDPAEDDGIKQRRILDVALRQAMAKREFFLLYQPQHDLRSGDMIGVEALVRWRSPVFGLVSPADFIPLAEETGLIVQLGGWVLEQACLEAMQWDWNGRLAVNVSVGQFRLGNLADDVRAVLERTGFPAARLDLEITESLFAGIDPKLLADLATIRALGVGIALDDFGTGYSSLSALATLPVDKIKIDQSFVRPLPDADKEMLVETIVLLAKRLGKTLVAEGIETEEQRDYLRKLQCDVGQGYFFGRPSLPETLDLVKRTVRIA